MIIYDAFSKALSRPARKPIKDLYVSDLGAHPYKAMLRVLEGVQPTFEQKNLEKMECGVALEENTIRLLSTRLPMQTQFPLWNDLWNGYADIVLQHETDTPIIIEHKATDSKAFNFVPKSTHCCQLWMYGELYKEMFGAEPRLILVYRSWGKWAEYVVTARHDLVVCDGFKIDDGIRTYSQVELLIDPAALRAEMEEYYGRGELPDPFGSDSWTYPEIAYRDRLSRLQGGSTE